MFKVATWNVNSLKVRLPHVLQWLNEQQPEVLALQETKLVDTEFPHQAFAQLGYSAAYIGQKTYNGVAILSKQPLTDIEFELPGLADPQRRFIAGLYGNVKIVNLYIPNGESITSAKFEYKSAWLAALHSYLHRQIALFPKLVVVGDFNIAPTEQDVHDPLAWQESVLFTPSMREVFNQLLALGLADLFRLFPQAENSFSWWDYRAASFRRNLGLRIDHILATKELADACQACHIDKAPRKWERPSDHTPVIASFS